MVDHTIIHFETPADDVEKMREFYSKLFGWKIVKVPNFWMDYWLIETVPTDENGMPIRPGVNGGMMQKRTPDQKPVNYISVESVDEYAKKIEALGGKIIVPKTEVQEIGWWALALDPEGNQFAIMEEMGPSSEKGRPASSRKS